MCATMVWNLIARGIRKTWRKYKEKDGHRSLLRHLSAIKRAIRVQSKCNLALQDNLVRNKTTDQKRNNLEFLFQQVQGIDQDQACSDLPPTRVGTSEKKLWLLKLKTTGPNGIHLDVLTGGYISGQTLQCLPRIKNTAQGMSHLHSHLNTQSWQPGPSRNHRAINYQATSTVLMVMEGPLETL